MMPAPGTSPATEATRVISFRFSATTVDAKHTEFAESRDLCETCDVNVDHRCEHGRPGLAHQTVGRNCLPMRPMCAFFRTRSTANAHARDDRESCDFLIES